VFRVALSPASGDFLGDWWLLAHVMGQATGGFWGEPALLIGLLNPGYDVNRLIGVSKLLNNTRFKNQEFQGYAEKIGCSGDSQKSRSVFDAGA
jgi:hypothetical protein